MLAWSIFMIVLPSVLRILLSQLRLVDARSLQCVAL